VRPSVDVDPTEGEPGRWLRVPSDDTRIHVRRPEDGPTKEDIQRAKVDDLDAAIVAALRADPMFANRPTKSIRRLRDDVYAANGPARRHWTAGAPRFVLHVAAEVS
jgi:acyl-CoA reductase-like NAD-dependent aldehyde dehydrogenase